MVEFALAIPVVLTLLLAVVVFGVAFNNDLQLTFATSNATQQLSILRGQTTDPCKDTSKVLFAAAPTLNQSKIKFTIVLNGTTVAGPNAATPTCSGTPPDATKRDAADDGENACSAMLTRIASSIRP